ncbi:MAG: HU family DNA-binding protein [Rhodobacterales bacterium]|nr:HU family DNA-binding protein [Rhodobacterales bacterium]
MARAVKKTNTSPKTATKTTAKVTKKAASRPATPVKSVSKSATVSKATATRAKAVKSATRAAPTPKVVAKTTPAAVAIMPAHGVSPDSLEMKKKELIDKVVLRSGIKKKDAKPVVEAMLAVLGETLGDGRALNLQPLGKVKINRMKQVAKDRVIICKIRQSGRVISEAEKSTETPIAGAAE